MEKARGLGNVERGEGTSSGGLRRDLACGHGGCDTARGAGAGPGQEVQEPGWEGRWGSTLPPCSLGAAGCGGWRLEIGWGSVEARAGVPRWEAPGSLSEPGRRAVSANH